MIPLRVCLSQVENSRENIKKCGSNANKKSKLREQTLNAYRCEETHPRCLLQF